MDQLEQDQSDIYGRILADSYFVDVPVLLEQKGVTDSDIHQALATLNARGGKIGAVAIVLMGVLAPESPNAPGPRWVPRFTIQVIDQPLFNLGTGGTGKTASQIAERVRMIIHRFRSVMGAVLTFAGQEPIPVDPGYNSLGVAFTREGGDYPPPKCSTVIVAPAGGVAPQTVTLTCGTAGVAIYYTLDGSYPSAANGVLYAAPFSVPAACTFRAVASKTAFQQSDISQVIFT